MTVLWQYYDILIVLIFQYVSYNHHLHISSTQMCLEEAERMFFLRHLLWPGNMFSLFGDHRAWCSTLKLEQCLKTTSAWFGGFKDFCAILRHAKTLNMSSRSSTSISFRPISNMFQFLLVLHTFFVQTPLSWPLPYRGRPLGVASCMIFSWNSHNWGYRDWWNLVYLGREFNGINLYNSIYNSKYLIVYNTI